MSLTIVAFIHDEVMVEVPESENYQEICEEISRIMIESMRKICPDVEIRTESAVMKRWSKDGQVNISADNPDPPQNDFSWVAA